MKSNILKQGYEALIKINKAITPQERLTAFYQHSRLMNQLARAGEKARKKPAQIPHASTPSHL